MNKKLEEIEQDPQEKKTRTITEKLIDIGTEMEIAILKKVITALKQHISSIEQQKRKSQQLLDRLKTIQQERNAKKSLISKLFKLPKLKKKLHDRTFKQKIRKTNESLKKNEAYLQKNKKALATYEAKLTEVKRTPHVPSKLSSVANLSIKTNKDISLVLAIFSAALKEQNKHMIDTLLLVSFFQKHRSLNLKT